EDLLSRTPASEIGWVAVTGAGGKLISSLLGCDCINEIVAQSKAVARLHPRVRSIIEIGGEDSKLILLESEEGGEPRVKDFATNTICAAGTGSFLDQQAVRLGVRIEKEFGRLASRSENPPRIAGRCSVFAKTDMIHLQQEATPDYDIVAGLCFALARNFRSNIAKGKELVKPVSFQGGVAFNEGMIRAFTEVLELKSGELVIPEHRASMGAIGAVLVCAEKSQSDGRLDLEPLRGYLAHRRSDVKRLEPLVGDDYPIRTDTHSIHSTERIPAYLGVDIGSISTNVVVIDEEGHVLSRRYLMTAGRPIPAVQRGIAEVGGEVADKVDIVGVGTTGSGRYLIGDLIGADVVKNEITAHATGAAHYDKRVDTIFEIGGQDSKYVSLENGAVVDFTMNKVCAAGTGSFLEEQAEKLGISIKGEFSDLALHSRQPAHLGERCTVFMESDLNQAQQRGVAKEDLVAGLCYSIVYNYLNKVVEDRKIGDVIFFQGGTAYNRGVKAAFERVLGKTVIVPPHHDVLGAIGVALIARNESAGTSKFKGFDLAKLRYEVESFECRDCANHCEVRRVSVPGEAPLYYGSRCGKYDEKKKASRGEHLPRLFKEREEALLDTYSKDLPSDPGRARIGIPRIAEFFDLYPMWKAYFTELGFDVVLSDPTNRPIINEGLEHIVAETCFPIKVAHGHVANLLRKRVQYLFLPAIISLEHTFRGMQRSYACPYVQSIPYLLQSAMALDATGAEVLAPIFHMERGEKHVRQVFRDLAHRLGKPAAESDRALAEGFAALRRFESHGEARGREILASLPAGAIAMVIVSRPYNGCDPGLNLDLPGKLRDLGVLAIPMDFLPLSEQDISRDFPNMYWKYGQKILAAARVVAQDSRLNALYITNFGCGPDSFISKFFSRELRGKPYLTIEVDEHSADVGAITRCEAFIDSLKNVRAERRRAAARGEFPQYVLAREKRRKIYIPFMDDHGEVMAAAMQYHGYDAEVLPMTDAESITIGRSFTSGKECYPCILTTGDIVKCVRRADFDPDRSGFLMPSAQGPCRFGQYHKFHRMVLDDLGLAHVPIVTLDQTKNFTEDLKNLGTRFRRICWDGFVLIDLMQKMVRHIRPYEIHRNETDDLYRRLLQQLVDAVRSGGDVEALAQEARASFDAIQVDRSESRPPIGMVGEIFVRSNPFANNFVVRRIEALGGETSQPPLEEWIDYIGWERKRDYRLNGDLRKLLVERLADGVQERALRRLSRYFDGALPRFQYEADTPDILQRGNRYLNEAVRGEAVLSMGRAVEYAEHGFAGVVNLIPFNCIPGTIVTGLMKRFREEHNDIPFLNLVYDGDEQAGEEMRLEAFMYQAKQYMDSALVARH
ncbi:MAG: CoA activase, partial [Coriobacteriia bacterium]|nr:CoA activase [Coriobacteriia bacterium]